MDYGKGTIAFKSGTVFKDGQIDPRKGHPVMLPIASDDISQETYYLLLDSHPEKRIDKYIGYFNLLAWHEIGLPYPSTVNIRDIYKAHINGKALCGMPPKVYKEVIRNFKEFQEEHPDEFYEEIKGKLR